MNFKALLSVFALFISSISALSVIDFPLNLRVEPGSELSVQLEGNNISAGDLVRVELWDNQDDEDVNAAVLGEELKVNSDLSVNFDIPAHFPKTKNAFLRVYYKCHNTVSPRFSIKPAKNCLDNKKPHKPIEIATTPMVIYQPSASHIAGPMPSAAVIASPVATPVANSGSGAIAPIIAETSGSSIIRPTASIKSSATIMSTSTSTSSASVAKISAGSIVIALTVAFALLF